MATVDAAGGMAGNLKYCGTRFRRVVRRYRCSDVATLSLFHYNELAAGGLRRDVRGES